VYRITAVPISLSLVTQTGRLENLYRLDAMIVEEVAKIGRHTISGLGARFVERFTKRRGGRGYALEFQDGRDSMQQGGVRHGRDSMYLVRVASKLAGASVLSDGKSDLRQGR